MLCPKCQSPETATPDSRNRKDGLRIRTRKCKKCDYVFKTTEVPGEFRIGDKQPLLQTLRPLKVIKRDGRLVDFDDNKLLASISLPLRKSQRENIDLETVVAGVKNELIRDHEKDNIESATIGKYILKALLQLDMMAYLRYASIYRDIKTIQDFKDLLDKIDEESDKS